MSDSPLTSGKCVVLARAIAVPGQEEVLAARIKAVRDSACSDAEPDTLEFRINRHENYFAVYQIYLSPEAFDYHKNLPAFQALMFEKDKVFAELIVKFYNEF